LTLADVARLAGVPETAAGNAPTEPGAVLRRVGAEDRGSASDDLATYLAAGGVVAIAGGAVVYLAARRRRTGLAA
jgi:hypothetical protein